MLPALVLMLAAPATAPVSSDALARAWNRTREAEAALLRGDVERAQSGLVKALHDAPDFPAARLGLGHIAMARRDWRGAFSEYSAARDGFERGGAALDAIESERYAQAREDIARLAAEAAEARAGLAAPPKRAAGREAVGELDERILRARLEQNLLRIRQLEAVRPPGAERPGVPGEVDYHLGNALFRLGRANDAVAAWSACAEKLDNFAPVYNNLAVAYLGLGRLDEARRSAEKAERLGMEVDERIKTRVGAPADW